MWPQHGDALSRTIAAEQAVEDLYAEALRRWLPDAHAAMLPSLPDRPTAVMAGVLPPDPAAVQQTQQQWAATAETVVVTGLGLLWAATVFDALIGLGLPLPSLPATIVVGDLAVLAIVNRAVDNMDSKLLIEAANAVQTDPVLRAARDDFLTTQRAEAATIPAAVQAKAEAAIREIPVTDYETRRATVAAALEPGGQDMREIARTAGYQAAAVQNHAVIEAAQLSGGDGLDKIWLATIDQRTRDTHFAADMQRAPLAGTFTVGGEQLAFPGDPTGTPGETYNCRCRVGILAHDEELPSEVDRHTERLNGRDSTARNREGSQADEIRRRAADGTIRAREDPEGIGRTAAGGWAAPSGQEYDMTAILRDEAVIADKLAALAATKAATMAVDSAAGGETFRTFTDAVIALVGTETSDGRMLAADINLTFRDFPLPLMWCKQSVGGHMEAFTVGAIESATVTDGKVLGSGYLLNSTEADEAADQIHHGVTGPSVDLAAAEWKLTDQNGNDVSEEDYWGAAADDKFVMTITAAELIGTTLVATPAFGATTITLNEQRESRDAAVVASAAEEFRPRVYDHRLFADPKLSGPTLPTMGDDGRIYGHLACFGECHRSIQAQCVMAPRSRTNYSHFHTSPAVRLDNGESLPVGRLTVGTGHASPNVVPGAAIAHYDNTGTCFALVRVGEDAHGIWFSGVAAPWATTEQIEQGLASPLSGDWRDFGQGLELVAALAVNTPGFAARGRDDKAGRPIALVASLGPAPSTKLGGVAHLSRDDIKTAVREALIEQTQASLFAAERDEALARAAKITTPPTPRQQIGELLAVMTDGAMPTSGGAVSTVTRQRPFTGYSGPNAAEATEDETSETIPNVVTTPTSGAAPSNSTAQAPHTGYRVSAGA